VKWKTQRCTRPRSPYHRGQPRNRVISRRHLSRSRTGPQVMPRRPLKKRKMPRGKLRKRLTKRKRLRRNQRRPSNCSRKN